MDRNATKSDQGNHRETSPNQAPVTEGEHVSEVLTVEEAARVLRLSRGSTYQAIREGQIPARRIGKRLLVPRRALMSLLGVDQDSSGALERRA